MHTRAIFFAARVNKKLHTAQATVEGVPFFWSEAPHTNKSIRGCTFFG